MSDYPFLNGAYAFGVCRIEPENNIHVILEAFAKDVAMPLVMVGNWNHGEYGMQLRKQYSELEQIHLLDPIYDPTKLNELRSHCTIYLHGHSCGGTNPSLVEAMYLGLPIAAFDVNFNRETTEQQALYFKTAEELREIVNRTDRNILQKKGEIMREISERRYTWARISSLYAELF